MIIKTNIETEKGNYIADSTSFKMSKNVDIFIYAFPFEYDDKITIGDNENESEGIIERITPLSEVDLVVKKVITNALNRIDWNFDSEFGHNPTIVFVSYPPNLK